MSARSGRRTALLWCALPVCAVAQQVGTTPDKSPFRDLEKRQDVTLLVGASLLSGKDRAGAAPRGGSVFGLRYDLGLGSAPLTFTSVLLRQGSSREVIQPGLPLANRSGGTVSQPLWFFDLGLTMLLTGNRSWHGVQPSVTAGAGIAYDGAGIGDSSNFDFGTRFNPVVGLGVKYTPERSRWTARVDLTNRFYSVPYPQSFRDTVSGVPRVVGTNVNSAWTRNMMLTLGLVRGIGRR